MKVLRFLIISIFLLSLYNCSSNDDSGESKGIHVKNLVTNFDENPNDGAVVGTIQAVSKNILSFSISFQTPAGALGINPSTGELKVANATLFDFETNPVISATISIADLNSTTSATATINLNDLDDIASFLSTSKGNYLAAADGKWISITAAEYNTLAFSLNNVTKVATSDTEYDSSETSSDSSLAFTGAINNGMTIPNNSYVFAFKYYTSNLGVTTNKAKQSNTSISDGYMDLGGTLPPSIIGENYMVLKGSHSQTTNTGFLGIYQSQTMRIKSISGTSYNYYNSSTSINDSNTLPSTGINAVFLYQGLSTTQKQW
ncbi:MAG TPA: cadherin repeat domain-containing protein [Xanthomarina sp.]|nr:cadherin repeat domain-containing protein [Xanthomarina sp.]